ncbi:hypothetical protein [Sinorhizobium meliloti]|uniref:hypothetical protein n=1 Tax=Rhizobium meliloti TaxID=382 RepID=UPI0005181F71|nr:hypothetical protein [Sinorhizobium meliloti]
MDEVAPGQAAGLCEIRDRHVAVQIVQDQGLGDILLGAGQFSRPGSCYGGTVAVLLHDMDSDCGGQLIDEQPACLLRMFEGGNQGAPQVGENGIRMGSDRVDRSGCREVGLLCDQCEGLRRYLEKKEIEGSLKIGFIVLSQTADVDRVVVEYMRRCVVLVKDAACMSWKCRDSDCKSTVAGGHRDLLQEGFP